MPDSGAYPNAPLALVAFEVRYPEDESLMQRASLDKLKAMLADYLPLPQKLQQHEVVVQVGSEVPPAVKVQAKPRFATRDKTTACQIGLGSLIVETTAYESFESFSTLIRLVVDSVASVARPDGITRIGLRYIDEVRVPGITEPPGDWRGYISEHLLAPVAPEFVAGAELELRTWQGVVQYGTGQDQSLALRYGPSEGYAVPPSGPTRRQKVPESGLFFLLDFDSYWEPRDEVPEFSSDVIMDASDKLHRPAKALFDAVVEEKLRNEVFMQLPEEEARTK